MSIKTKSISAAVFFSVAVLNPAAHATESTTATPCNTHGLERPSGESTGRWETVAAIKGGINSLVKINENWYECAGGAPTRGIHYLVGALAGMTPDDSAAYIHAKMLEGLKTDRATAFVPYTKTKKEDGTVEETGGSAGDVDDFKRVKDGVVAWLVANKGMKNVTTTATKIGTSSPSAFLNEAATAIAAGKAVEIDVDMGGNAGHIAFVAEIVRRGNDWGLLFADDDQNNGIPETRPRGPYFFTDGGECYYFETTASSPTPCKFKLRGMLIEEAA